MVGSEDGEDRCFPAQNDNIPICWQQFPAASEHWSPYLQMSNRWRVTNYLNCFEAEKNVKIKEDPLLEMCSTLMIVYGIAQLIYLLVFPDRKY